VPTILTVGPIAFSFNLNSEVEQVVLVLLLVLENSRYLTVTLIDRSSAGRFGPCFDAGSQQNEHEHDVEHEHDSGFVQQTGQNHPMCMWNENAAVRSSGSIRWFWQEATVLPDRNSWTSPPWRIAQNEQTFWKVWDDYFGNR
jgi:hypothetical protein